MSNWVDFLPLLLLVVIFWLLIVRPARSRQKAFLQTQRELAAGDKVMLASGIFGEIVTISDETVELRIAPSTVIQVKRQAIAQVERENPAVEDPASENPALEDPALKKPADDSGNTDH